MKFFVTGGLGFIGSNFVDSISKQNTIVVYDNFSKGNINFLDKNNPNLRIIKADIIDYNRLRKEMNGADVVAHFAANADVRRGIDNPDRDIEQNILATHNVLKAMKENKVNKILFSSTAAIYGEPNEFPTKENYAPVQTSIYGASKISAEAIIQSYCEYYNIQSWIFRFTSFIGERYTHGLIFDFVNKLIKNPLELEILGDGNQKKSYCYVKDGIEAMNIAFRKNNEKVNILNIGQDYFLTVKDMADIVCSEMGLKNVKYRFRGGARGWIGDSPKVHLDITKLKSIGWTPKVSIEEGARRTVRYLLKNKELLERTELSK